MRVLARRLRSAPPPSARPSFPVEQVALRAGAVQLIALFGSEDAKWKVGQLMNDDLDDETAAVVRGQLDAIARRVFRAQGSQWGWT